MYNKPEMTYDRLKEKALRLLEFRNQSEFELRQKLQRSGGENTDITKVLDFCKEYGFVNDEKYAHALACDLKNLKKYGKQRIRAELNKRGINHEYISSVLEELDDDIDNLTLLIEKRLKGDFDKKNCDKAIRYFVYRGYKLDDIIKSIERLKTDEF